MPLILPARFASLADAAAAESTRYAMTGVLVRLNAKQTRLTATDSRILLDVALPLSGPEVADYGREFPKSPALDAAPNSAMTALVDPDLWRSMRGKRARRAAIVLGDKITTIGTIAKPEKIATDVDVAVAQATNVEGRFPPADDIVRDCQRQDVWARFRLSAGSLAKLLKAMAGIINQENDLLDFEVRGAGKPIVVKATDPETAAAVTGMIMPMGDGKDVQSEEYNRQAIAETLASKAAAVPTVPLAEHDAACKQYRDTIVALERRVKGLQIAAAQALPPAPVAAQAGQGDTVTVDREEYERMLRMARQAGYTPPAD